MGIYIVLVAKLTHKSDHCIRGITKYVKYDRQGVFIDVLTGQGEADMLDRSRISVWLVCSHERNKDFLRSPAVQGTVIDQGMSGPCVRISGFSIDAGNAARSRHGSKAHIEHQTIKNGWGPLCGYEGKDIGNPISNPISI